MIGSSDKEPQTGKVDISCDATKKIDNTSSDGMQNNTTEPLNDMQISTEKVIKSTDISDEVVANCSEVQTNNKSPTLEHTTTQRKNTDEPQLSNDIQDEENNIPTKSDNILNTAATNNRDLVDCSQTEKIEQQQVVESIDNSTSSDREEDIDDDHYNEINEDEFVAIELVSPKNTNEDEQLTTETEHPAQS